VYAVLLSIEAVRDTIVSRPSSISPVYDQLVWLLAYGHEPFSTVISRPLLGGHFQPGIVLLTPIYWLDLGVPGSSRPSRSPSRSPLPRFTRSLVRREPHPSSRRCLHFSGSSVRSSHRPISSSFGRTQSPRR